MVRLEEAGPQAVQCRWQIEPIEQALYFVQVQAAQVLGAAVQQHLLDVPLVLEWIIQVDAICAPHDMPRRLDGRHARTSAGTDAGEESVYQAGAGVK
jgi:hypothetical protein